VRVAGSGLGLWLAAAGAIAQERELCTGPERSATPIDVTLDDLALSAAYRRKAVRTKGDVEVDVDTSGRRRYRLRDGQERVALTLCAEIGRDFEEMAIRRPRLVVVGLAMDSTEVGATQKPLEPATRVVVWEFTDVSETERPRRTPTSGGIAEVMESDEAKAGKTVRMLGQFGGRNLLKDLPADSAPDPAAWVLRDGSQAVWVIGKRPEGSGFKLDPGYAPDAGKWLVVEGKIEPCAAGLCLRARRLMLSAPPS
jgi:hypothetical protein